ncbi:MULTISPECIES: CoA-transferase [unclassified Haladaptatus]|uniref:CoA transferase subunit A n=1 Tax=unclassified Haladaptatus TaxID=2622732 RepID=UPI00209C0C32|nr:MULTISPECIES: CoA-transferase [unclassified Haladaptatus]MCO8243487.1 CoA transferase subunit A [Haladaptatus sp. AB643]MCO8254896.1 CoA transferase subunit A [Haladaptatus sp. AB618]
MTKVTDLTNAISGAVDGGDSVYLGGFTHLIPFAAGHEIIRQGYEDLHLMRATPDLVFDQMIAAGCASAVTFSWAGNPGVGSLRAFRRAVEDGVPNEITIDEYSHFGLVSRLFAGARDMPFVPLRSLVGSSLPEHNDNIRTVQNPFAPDEQVCVVPPLNPDVSIVRGQRASPEGDAHLWGITGDVVDAAFAADTVVLCVEEIVDAETLRSDPNRTEIPGTVVDYVVEAPYGSHPSYTQGYYGRDNAAYLDWNEMSKTHETTQEWLDEWVYGVEDRREYVEKLGAERLLDLEPTHDYAEPIDMGRYA